MGKLLNKPKPKTFFIRSFLADRTKTRERSRYDMSSLRAVKTSLQSTPLQMFSYKC